MEKLVFRCNGVVILYATSSFFRSLDFYYIVMRFDTN